MTDWHANTAQLDLVHLQLALECIGLNDQGRLARIPGPDPDDIARVYAYRLAAGGYHVYLRHDLPAAQQAALDALAPARVFGEPGVVWDILETETETETETEAYQTYLFPEPLPAPTAVVVEQMTEGNAVYVILDGENIVSSCTSSRENERAGECYVFTEPAYRGRALGQQVTLAWAAALRRRGKVPFYSHNVTNTASARVAAKLGLIPCFSVVTYG